MKEGRCLTIELLHDLDDFIVSTPLSTNIGNRFLFGENCQQDTLLLQGEALLAGTYPFQLRSTKFHNRLPHLPRQCPRLRLIPGPPNPRRPLIQINRKLIRHRPHVTLLLGQEIIHEPAILDQRPLHVLGLGFQDLTERFASGAVEAGAVGKTFNITTVFGGHEALAGFGGEAGGEEGTVDGDVAVVVEVEEGEEGGGICVVEDREDGVVGVVADVNGDVAGSEPSISLASC